MKITKKQLKRIIAEEHKVVYGTKPRASRKRRQLTLTEKKRQIKRDYRYQLLAEEMYHDGLAKTQLKGHKYQLTQKRQLNEFRALRKLSNFFSGVKANFSAAKDVASNLKKDFDEYVKNTSSEAIQQAADQKKEAIKKQIQDLVKNLTGELIKDLEGTMTDQDKEKVGEGEAMENHLKTLAAKVINNALAAAGVDVQKAEASSMQNTQKAAEKEEK